MNALPAETAFIRHTATEWLVLRCAPSRTMALAAALADLGAWTPTWKRRRRMPRSTIFRPTTEPCIPSFVFVPVEVAFSLPPIPRIPFGFMRNADATMVRVSERSLEPLRKIADKPLTPARLLPKVGRTYKIVGMGFEGLTGKVLACSIRKARVEVQPWGTVIEMPPGLLVEG